LNTYNLEKVKIESSTFYNNKATLNEAGGAYLNLIGDVEVISTLFANNYAGLYSGGMTAYMCTDVTVSGSAFDGNIAGQWAGALNIEEVTDFTIKTSIFTGNQDLCSNCEVSLKAFHICPQKLRS